MITCHPSLLPSPLVPEEGPPPDPPLDYEDNFVLPQHSEKPLQTRHFHPLDGRLVFYEIPHVYTFDGVPTSVSVTGLAHEFEKPFDPEAAIASMKTGRSQAWPRLEYVVDPLPLDARDNARGALLVRCGKTIAACQPHSLSEGKCVQSFLASVARPGDDDAEDEYFSFRRALTDSEIRDKWERNGLLARNRGTEGHLLAELYFNGLPSRSCPEMDVVHSFAQTHLLPRGLIAYNTEKEIVCADADVAGSIDLILYDPATGMHHVVDHKRSDKLRQSLRGFSKMKAPFAHLDDCKGAAYALQTSIYQYILEREYGMTIGDRILLSIHPDAPFATSVPYLKAEVEWLMERRFRLVERRREVAAGDAALRCSLTGAPLVDAVRLEDGTHAMEKAALVRDLAFTPAEEMRARFDAAVGDVTVAPPAKKSCIPWRKRMPEEGIVPFADYG